MDAKIKAINKATYKIITSGYTTRLGGYISGLRYYTGEYNLYEYGRIIDTEALVARAFGRLMAVIFRNGYTIKSKNKKNLKRVKSRIKEMEYVSGNSFSYILEKAVRSLVTLHNCYILITRSDKSSTSKGNKGKKPIAAISVVPAETMEIRLDSDGMIIGYRQKVGATIYEWEKDDVVHIAYDQRSGMMHGTPPLESVKDDIIALRKIEENVELLIDRSIFPILHAKVGTEKNPAKILETGFSEIDDVAAKMEQMERTGGLVTNERVDVKAIGAESLALRVESYLNYFKTRVLIGLGVSAMDLGETNSTGITNGEVLSLNIIDKAESYQKAIEEAVNYIFLMLMEDDRIIRNLWDYEDDEVVVLDFLPTNQDKNIKAETHWTDMYTKGVVTIDEARARMDLPQLVSKDRLFTRMTEAPKPVVTTKETKSKDNEDLSSEVLSVSDFLPAEMRNVAINSVCKFIMDTGVYNDNMYDKIIKIAEDVVSMVSKDLRLDWKSLTIDHLFGELN